MKEFDNSYLTDKIKLIAGVDEAGRGPLAGPVVAASAIFDPETIIPKVNDSKKLREKVRDELYDEIINKSLCYGIGIIEETEIDKINILQASLKAMKTAVDKMEQTPDYILIDGNKSFYTKIPSETVVKGDGKSFAIAAASIIAKVTRDKLMLAASKKFPQYGWERNKGYGTREHIEAIKKHGPTPLHRKTFLKNIYQPEELESFFG